MLLDRGPSHRSVAEIANALQRRAEHVGDAVHATAFDRRVTYTFGSCGADDSRFVKLDSRKIVAGKLAADLVKLARDVVTCRGVSLRFFLSLFLHAVQQVGSKVGQSITLLQRSRSVDRHAVDVKAIAARTVILRGDDDAECVADRSHLVFEHLDQFCFHFVGCTVISLSVLVRAQKERTGSLRLLPCALCV